MSPHPTAEPRPGRAFADDADHTHPWAAKYRIPLTGERPLWRYEVALVAASTNSYLPDRWAALTPTEDEARIVGSYIDFRRSYYAPHWARRKLERPFDVDDSTNTVTLLRTATDWAYSRASWRTGPPFVPSPVTTPDAAGLIALLDHINEYSSTWEPWKAAHPEVFSTGRTELERAADAGAARVVEAIASTRERYARGQTDAITIDLATLEDDTTRP